MSRWRQKGFVLDSDEEEEELLDNHEARRNASSSERVQRVDGAAQKGSLAKTRDGFQHHIRSSGHKYDTTTGGKHESGDGILATKYPSPKRRTASPSRIVAWQDTRQQSTESPDPIQSPESPNRQSSRLFPSAQHLEPPVLPPVSPMRELQHDSISIMVSQNLGHLPPPPDSPILPGPGSLTHASKILGEYGVGPLSDDSSDGSLSDPPSVIESPEDTLLTPHRRTTVQVVIQRPNKERALRQRKPIQLRPYRIESEIYRQTVQSRGLKPLPREDSHSSQRRHNSETQEMEFNPNQSPTSSPEHEIPVSTPMVQKSTRVAERGYLSNRPPSKTSRQPLSTQLRRSHSAKNRRVHLPLTQVTEPPRSIFESNVLEHDIWAIEADSPPDSNSRPSNRMDIADKHGAPHVPTPIPNLPTPSTSSVVQDDVQVLPGLTSGLPTPNEHDSSTVLRRPTRIVLSDSSPSSSESASESEQSDQELRKVSRRMKGVLPASWLRFDQKAQERRRAHEHARVHSSAAQSPQPIEPQRGVAHRIVRSNGRLRRASSSSTPSRNVVLVSDESDAEPGQQQLSHPAQVIRNSIEDPAVAAAIFDPGYADDNLSDMENDRLHLPTLGSTERKRKRQTKLTDIFEKSKKVKAAGGLAKGVASGSKLGGRKRRRHKNASDARATPLPALSIVDLEFSPSNRINKLPQFIRVARRQALRRPDLARQSPTGKQIRLQKVCDTEDANSTLQQWRQGSLNPKAHADGRGLNARRTPLAGKVDNQQRAQEPSDMEAELPTKAIKDLAPKSGLPRRPQCKVMRTSLHVFQRSSPHTNGPSRRLDIPEISWTTPDQSVRRNIQPSFRTAQLEGDEDDFSREHKKTAFEKGLHRVDEQFNIPLPQHQTHRNPLLARFLSDNDSNLPSPASTNHSEIFLAENSIKPSQAPKRRLRRKIQAHRVDVEAREYRQSSEPSIEGILKTAAPRTTEAESKQGLPVLHGLGPYGTRYATTYDVHSLMSDTYFHSTTFIGSDELRLALCIGTPNGRNLDEPSGHRTIMNDVHSVTCGPWNAETFSGIQRILQTIWAPFNNPANDSEAPLDICETVLVHLATLIRSLVGYISTHLSFLDPIDRIDFASKLFQLIQTISDRVFAQYSKFNTHGSRLYAQRLCIRSLSYLLVLGVQVYRIAQYEEIKWSYQSNLMSLVMSMSRFIIADLVQRGTSELNALLEANKRHSVRVKGIQESDVLAETVVLCMHTLDAFSPPGPSFWDIVGEELSSSVTKAGHIQAFELAWATVFTFLPFIEVDVTGIPNRDRRLSFQCDNWIWTRELLKRLLQLYPGTSRKHNASMNDYVRANLARCHRLISHWHWKRPEQMLNTVFDFFGKNGLRPLRHEENTTPLLFLDNLATVQSLAVEPNEYSFHVALKCLALGLRGMGDTYSEKRIRSFVFRTIPNHGRIYPKDQPLDEESLTALRNHHDLLSTLYWAAPPSCRPKLEHIRHLVSHEKSHREACRLNVRAWANLATFQLSTEEPYEFSRPFTLWHKDIMHQTLNQYQLANSEAEEFLKSGVLSGNSDVSVVMVRQTMERNQEKVIATLRDCIVGMRKVIKHARDQTSLAKFIYDSDILHLLELPHLEDRRLVTVIRDTLLLLQEYAMHQNALIPKPVPQQLSEESQDYGEFPDIYDFEDTDGLPPDSRGKSSILDFIEAPLWHLLSNAFGAETAPDETLLMDCVDTWVCIAKGLITSGLRSWSHYIDSFSQVSWQQLRHTNQARQFGPYFMATLIECDPTAYEEHCHEFLLALFVCLVDRESMLRFQDRLLLTIVRVDNGHPLLKNLPFFFNQQTSSWDITSDSLRSRRLALISSILSNMRDDVSGRVPSEQASPVEVKTLYAAMLRAFMAAMKNNYQQLQQGTTVAGMYVEFVHRIVQFLKQYTSDICPVLPFFTDSVAFPLPATDPTYVIGRLCGYAPKVRDIGTAKQLSVFVQTVAQQAALENQQPYLVNQLQAALCDKEIAPADRAALRSILLIGIFPAYLTDIFTSRTAFVIAQPILNALPLIFDTMIFDLRINQPASVSSITESILSIAHVLIRGTEYLRYDSPSFQAPQLLLSLNLMFQISLSQLPLLDYIWSRSTVAACVNKHPLISYLEEFSVFIAEALHDTLPSSIPFFDGDCQALPSRHHKELLAFCRRELDEGMRSNWSESDGTIWFGHGQARREVVFDIGSLEEERARLSTTLERFRTALNVIYGEDHSSERSCLGMDIIV